MGFFGDIWDWMNKPVNPDGERSSQGPMLKNQQGTGPTIKRPGTMGGPVRTSGARPAPVGPQPSSFMKKSPVRSVQRMAKPVPQMRRPQPNIRQAMEADNPFRGMPQMPQGGADTGAPMSSGYSDLMAQLEGKLDDEYTPDQEQMNLLRNAFAGRYGAMDQLRDKTRGNHAASDAALGELYAGHESDIKNIDSQRYREINEGWQQDIGRNYDGAEATIAADRDADARESEAMMKRLGIQAAGGTITEQANEQSDAIRNLNLDQADATATAQAYGNADQTRNMARGQAVAGEGIARKTDLRRQLDSILGQVDQEEASVRQEESQALFEADMAGRSAFQDSQRYNVETLGQLRDMQRQDNESAQGMEMQKLEMLQRMAEQDQETRERALDRQAEAQGDSPQQILSPFESVGNALGADSNMVNQARSGYADLAQNGNFNAQSGESRIDAAAKRLVAQGMDPAMAYEYAMGVENYGTYKYGSK